MSITKPARDLSPVIVSEDTQLPLWIVSAIASLLDTRAGDADEMDTDAEERAWRGLQSSILAWHNREIRELLEAVKAGATIRTLRRGIGETVWDEIQTERPREESQ